MKSGVADRFFVQRGGSARRDCCALRLQTKVWAAALLYGLLPLLSACQPEPPALVPQPQPSLSALFFSDTQAAPPSGDYAAWGALLAQAVAQAPQAELVILGGDTVNDGGDEAEWREFWQAAEEPLASLISAAVAGNHDNRALLAQQFAYPAQAPAQPGEGFFYAFDMGGVHFMMLDSNIMGAARPEDITWLQNDLQSQAAQEADWRVVVMHHPLWPLTENPKDTQRAATMRANFLPLMEEHGVDLILCGHQHLYARSLPMCGAKAAEEGGIVQIMAASGAKESYTATNLEHIAVSAAAPNYLLLTAESAALTVTAYDGQNKAFDTWMLKR